MIDGIEVFWNYIKIPRDTPPSLLFETPDIPEKNRSHGYYEHSSTGHHRTSLWKPRHQDNTLSTLKRLQRLRRMI